MDVSALERRLSLLEEALRRKESPRRRKGYTNQAGAAAYIGRSREWLRVHRHRGDGPPCNPDGSYSYEILDAYMRGEDTGT